MNAAVTGIEIPKDENGQPDIYAVPNIKNRKIFVLQVHNAHVALSFIRHRIRRYSRNARSLPGLFSSKLPEFSSYTVTHLLKEARKLDMYPLPQEISAYIDDSKTYDPRFDCKQYYEVCRKYAGASPVTKDHFVKILHLTSNLTLKVINELDQPLQIITAITKFCIRFLYTESEYVEYLNGYPWHTWYYSLCTFQVTNEEVVKSVVRSRLAKIYGLRRVSFNSLYVKCAPLVGLFIQELPDLTSYQIRCLLDELEDMDGGAQQTYGNDLLNWIINWVPNSFNVAEYANNIEKIYNIVPGLEGILKVFHFTCLITEHLFGQGHYSKVWKVIKYFLMLLSDEKWPFKQIIEELPWHQWYEQMLPNPLSKLKTRTSFDIFKYTYPDCEESALEQNIETEDTERNSHQGITNSSTANQPRAAGATTVMQRPQHLFRPSPTGQGSNLTQQPVQQHTHQHHSRQPYFPLQQAMPQMAQSSYQPHATQLHYPAGQPMQQYAYQPLAGHQYMPVQQPTEHYSGPSQLYDPTQQDVFSDQTSQQPGVAQMQQYAYQPQVSQYYPPAQQNTLPPQPGYQNVPCPSLMQNAYSPQPGLQFIPGLMPFQPYVYQPQAGQLQTLQQCAPSQQNALRYINSAPGAFLASGYQVAPGQYTLPSYTTQSTGQPFQANQQYQQTTFPPGNSGVPQNQSVMLQQQQQPVTYPSHAVDQQQQQSTQQTDGQI